MGTAYPVVPSDGIKDATSEHGDMVGARHVDEEQEADEVRIVVKSDAVVHPWTMMV
jgi:hypothetical protein